MSVGERTTNHGGTTETIRMGHCEISSEVTVPAYGTASGNNQSIGFNWFLNPGGYTELIKFRRDNRMNISALLTGIRLTSDNDVSLVCPYQIYLHGSGVYATGGYHAYSDDHLKSEEQPISSATETLLKLRPKRYKKHKDFYTTEASPDLSNVDWEHEAGFIAQEVEKVPELNYLVNEKEIKVGGVEHNVKALRYNDIIAYLVKGFQEQQERINVLEARCAKLD